MATKNDSEPRLAGWPGDRPSAYSLYWKIVSDHISSFFIKKYRPDIGWSIFRNFGQNFFFGFLPRLEKFPKFPKKLKNRSDSNLAGWPGNGRYAYSCYWKTVSDHISSFLIKKYRPAIGRLIFRNLGKNVFLKFLPWSAVFHAIPYIYNLFCG